MAHLAWHLTVDLFSVTDRRLLSDVDAASALMGRIRAVAGMGLLAEPTAVYSNDPASMWGRGATVIVPLTSSHMSLHCLEGEDAAHYDLFSCRQFDPVVVQMALQTAFGGSGLAILTDRCNGAELWRRRW